MGYKVEVNRRTKRRRLVFVATVRRHNIGPKGAPRRRLVIRDGRVLHVTKGWRSAQEAAQ